MIIHILTTDGSPLGVTLDTLYGKDSQQPGVGGAEYGLFTICEMFAGTGHEVVLYNDPRQHIECSFEQRAISSFVPGDNRDVLIIFRSPNPLTPACKGLKVWLSTDQYTIGDFKRFARLVDKIVVISPFHAEYFHKTYGIDNTIVIDLPVRVNDIPENKIVQIPNRLIFTSVPDRGLKYLKLAWAIIKMKVLSASLVITSDYRLWGTGANNERYRVDWMSLEDVQFIGAVNRYRLIEEQMKAQILAYPCIYDELFCVAVAEAQVIGAYPVTSDIGALLTTNMGTKILGNPQNNPNFISAFAEEIVRLLSNQDLLQDMTKEIMMKAYDRFHPDNILKQWENKVFNGNQ